MRAHVLEDQIAEFLDAIARELPGRHEPAGERRGEARRMRDLDSDLFFGTGVTPTMRNPTAMDNFESWLYRRGAGVDLLSARSTDHAPDPAIMIAAVIASTSK